ncbi:MAG: trypsin-like peptidase domain-containing protein [Phycisphaeraceae bacterium]|nr:trypsin-like peptidase domain-containing protein [Phycisphaeraceae bacterium]
MKARRSRLVHLVALALVGSLAALAGACSSGSVAGESAARVQSAAPTPAQLDGLPVVRILTPWGALGSGVPLADDVLITCRHCLPRGGTNRIEIDGVRRQFEVLAAGTTRDAKDDWAVIRVAPGGLPPAAPIDATRRVRDGEPVYLCGYWPGDGQRPERVDPRRVEPRAVCAVAVAVEGTRKLPADLTVFAEVGPSDIFKGMSGGPAAVWDRSSQRLVVIGIYLGAAEYEPGQAERFGRVQVIRRMPAEAVQAASKQDAELAPIAR